MKSEIKAFLLIFLCFFAATAIPLVASIAVNFAISQPYAFAHSTLPVEPTGDPIGTPGGGGAK